jgi:hypothetical protein
MMADWSDLQQHTASHWLVSRAYGDVQQSSLNCVEATVQLALI